MQIYTMACSYMQIFHLQLATGPLERAIQVSHYSLSFQLKNSEQHSESWRPSIHNSLTCGATAVQASLTHKSWNSSALSLRRDQPESLSHSASGLGAPGTEPACARSPSCGERLQAAMLHSPCYITHGSAFHTARKQGVFRGLKRK